MPDMTMQAPYPEVHDHPITERADVVVIGAGLAGALATVGLRRAGLTVALLEARAVQPLEFRAEKMGTLEMSAFERLGLGAPVSRAVTPFDEIWVARYGRRPVREQRREYGFTYRDLVAAVRDGGGAAPTLGKVVDITTTGDLQTVQLADGRAIAARLVVVATGLGETILRMVGARTEIVSAGHSLSLGFDLARPAADFPFGSLVAYGERRRDLSAYLTLFPIGQLMRGNLFVYRDIGDKWTRDFRAEPSRTLGELVPALRRWTGDLAVSGPVALRPLSLSRATGLDRPGIVLIGDAFMTCCPVTGVGIPKVVTDVARLLHHAPRWFATPGMGEAKIAAFYADPVKRDCDTRSLSASLFARQMVVADGPAWTARRIRNALVRHCTITMRQASASVFAPRQEGVT